MTAAFLLAFGVALAPSDTVAARLRAVEEAIARRRIDSAWADIAPRARVPHAGRLTLLEAGVVAHRARHATDAVTLLGRVLDAAPVDELSVEAHLWLADVATQHANFDEAWGHWSAALEGARTIGDRSREAEALTYLGGAALRGGNGPLAVARIDSAERAVPPTDDRGRARLRCQQALLYAVTGRGAESPALLEEGRRLAGAAADRRLEGQCLGSLGAMHAQFANWSLAAIVLDTAVQTLRRVGDARGMAAALQWQGYALRMLALYPKAERSLQEAIVLARLADDPGPVAWARLNLGLIAATFGDHERAAEAFDAAGIAFAESGDQWGRHSALLSWIDAQLRLGEVDAADSATARLAVWARAAGNAEMILAAHYRAANAAERRGDLAAAGRWLDSVDAVARRIRQPERLFALRYDRARVALAGGRPEQAIPDLRQYLAGLAPDVHARQYAARTRLAEALALSGRLDDAAREIGGATDELERWRASLVDPSLRRAVFAALVDDPDPDLGVATVIARLAEAGDLPGAFALAERRRARQLLDRLVRTAAAGGPERRARRGAANSVTDLASLRSAIPDSVTAVLSYVTGNGGEPTTAFVATAAGATVHRLPAIDSLRPLVARAVVLAESGAPIPSALGRELAQALLDAPLAALPLGVRRLVVVPEDVLHDLPFDLLPGPGGAPLGQTLVVSNTPSASVLAALWQRSSGGATGLLALADPPPPEGDSVVTEAGSLGPLPGARREARALGRLVAGAETRTGPDATEERFRLAAGRSVLHLATHAVVDERSPLRTFVLLAPGAGQDGRLTAAELEELDLGADLVVLSACRTARGRILAGEGVLGLTAPLLAAGTRAVVASRWAVDDDATTRLMVVLYERLLDGTPVGEALHAARLDAIERGEPPAVWAAFTLVGDPFVTVALRRRRSPAPFVLLLIGGAVAAAGFLVGRRRRLTA
ncbi:MAG: CHAT domain-containing protein [Gemmatimonadales bacterium]